jgi:Gpi18-like mannosyltransferase
MLTSENEITQKKDSVPVPLAENVVDRLWARKWLDALKATFPLYIAIHIAAFVITCTSVLISHPDFYTTNPQVMVLLQSWNHWDSGWYQGIATRGYTTVASTAFFPLYPVLIRVMMVAVPDQFLSGLVVSNLADLAALVLLYQLINEDFGEQRARSAVRLLATFPTAFFLLAAYNESLFLALSLGSFYLIRRGNWWLAGLVGCLATLTRSSGLLLLLPFVYEYLRQRAFQWRKIRLDILGASGFPAGLLIFAIYCLVHFHNALLFFHAESTWKHVLAFPWIGMLKAWQVTASQPDILSYRALRSLIDLVPDVLVLVLLVLGIVGPWRLQRNQMAYLLYGGALYLFLQLFPTEGLMPLVSLSRYLLEVFPAFIVLSQIRNMRFLNASYQLATEAGFFALLTLFLMNHWIV